MARTGRRPGAADTRGTILDAARRRFAEDGFHGATIRSIAAAAEVDPALVHHYFGTKGDLFAAVVEFPIDPAEVGRRLLAGVGDGRIGHHIVATFLEIWERPEVAERMRILIASALTDGRTARMMREFVTGSILGPIADELAVDDGQLRAAMVGSQLVGLAMVRLFLRPEPIASLPRERVVELYGPTIERYLTGPLDGG